MSITLRVIAEHKFQQYAATLHHTDSSAFLQRVLFTDTLVLSPALNSRGAALAAAVQVFVVRQS